MRSSLRGSILLLLMLGAPPLAQAAWQPDGNLIGAGTGFVATASGPDRVIVAWFRQFGSSYDYEVRAQAWTADGDLVAGWPADGVLVTGGPLASSSVPVAEDGAGGVFVAWSALEGANQSVRVQHLSASGVVAAGWPQEGVALGASYPVTLAPDGAGGVLVARLEYDANYSPNSRVIVHRLDAAALPVPGWPADGLPFLHTHEVGLLVDADHHVFVSTAESDPATGQWLGMIVRRLQENGTPDPAWPANGVLIEDGCYGSRPRLFPDGAGGVFPQWALNYVCVDYCPYVPNQWAARVLGDGSTHSGWIPPPSGYSIAPDGLGGILVGLIDAGRPAVVRLDANGSVMPGWAPEGSPAMTESVNPYEVGVTGDGQGGAYVTWMDSRGGNSRLYASRLDAAGQLVSGWPSTGSVVSTHTYPFGTALVSLGNAVAVVVWHAADAQGHYGHSGYLTALHPGEPGPIAELGPAAGDVGFGVVSIRPNPARGPIVAMVELPSGGPARLDLVDATGRLVDSREFDFWAQARGAVQFNQGRTLPAGVYWLRLTQGGRVSSKKAVLLE